jgi:tetratricopeptide (TPR) repeat protein
MKLRICLFYLLLTAALPALAQTVPEEARRHMVRGNAAVEMARSNEDFALALEEFQQAASLAPSWPDPFYNLGMIQEKLGKYGEAVRSLKRYLELAPTSSDAGSIRDLVYKLEFKAEQTLTPRDVIEVLTSGFSVDTSRWQKTSSTSCGRDWSMQELLFRPEGGDAVRVFASEHYYPTRESYQTLRVTGPKVKYTVLLNVCSPEANRQLGNCDSIVEHEVEVVSRRRVQVRQLVIRQGSGGGTPATGQRSSCTYERK